MNQDAFFELAARLIDRLRGDEILFCGLDGEESSFVRLNRNRISQAGCLYRQSLDLNLISGARQLEGRCELSGYADQDLALAQDMLKRLRDRLSQVPEDPFLLPDRVWHIDHCCHKKEFLLKFAHDCRRWLHWLLEATKRFGGGRWCASRLRCSRCLTGTWLSFSCFRCR